MGRMHWIVTTLTLGSLVLGSLALGSIVMGGSALAGNAASQGLLDDCQMKLLHNGSVLNRKQIKSRRTLLPGGSGARARRSVFFGAARVVGQFVGPQSADRLRAGSRRVVDSSGDGRTGP